MPDFYPERLSRKPYFFRSVYFFLTVGGSLYFLSLFPAVNQWFSIALVVVALAYRLGGLDIPRAKDMGWSPWVPLVQLIPGFGIAVVILLLLVPSNTFPLKGLREARHAPRSPRFNG